MPLNFQNVIPVACLAGLLAGGGTGRPAAAATEWQQAYLEPAVQAWMGVVTLLAEDGERAEKGESEQCDGDCQDGCMRCDGKDDKGRRHGERHRRHAHAGSGHHHGGPAHGRMGPPRPEGPRGDALAMLNDIVGRLSRIEAMLADRGPMMGRGAGGPPAAGRGAWQGRGGPHASPEMRAMMEARMKEGREKMQEAREKWEQASPEEREEMKKQMESRRREYREKMEQARAEQGGQPGDADQLRQAMDRFREEGRKRMEEATTKMEEARKRFREMEQRLERLEAEVARMKEAAEKSD